MKKIMRVLLSAATVLMISACSSSSDGGESVPHDPAFVTTWETNQTGFSSDNEILISTANSIGRYFNIDWGDGTVDDNMTGDNTHAYTQPGIYTVKITGDFPRIFFGSTENYDPKKLISVDNWGDIQWTTMSEAFSFCSNMQINATDAPDLSNVTEMGDMFYGATSMNANINHWDVSHVEIMNAAFMNAASFNQPLDKWDTSNVTDMAYMFSGASAFSNHNLSGWNVDLVTSYSNFMSNAGSGNTEPIWP